MAQWEWKVEIRNGNELEDTLNACEGDGWDVHQILVDPGVSNDLPTAYTVISRRKPKRKEGDTGVTL